MKRITILFLLLTTAVFAAHAQKIETAEQLISAMHKKYAGKWYKTLVFAQKTTTFKPDGTTQNGIWYEALSMPGKLRIDFDPLETGSGATRTVEVRDIHLTSDPLHPRRILRVEVTRQ